MHSSFKVLAMILCKIRPRFHHLSLLLSSFSPCPFLSLAMDDTRAVVFDMLEDSRRPDLLAPILHGFQGLQCPPLAQPGMVAWILPRSRIF
jgi:hypothetical protein